MVRFQLIVVFCALALTVGCASKNKSTTQTASKWEAERESVTATTQPTRDTSGETSDETSEESEARGNPTTAPSANSATAANNPLAGEWQLAIPRRPQRGASIVATDGQHVRIEAGKTLSGDYIVQGNFLLMVTNDERLRPLAWKINSNDSLTIVRAPDMGPGSSAFKGITLLRAPDESTVETEMDELLAP